MNYKVSEYRLICVRESTVENKLLDNPEKVVEFWKSTIPAETWYSDDKECLVVLLLNTRRKIIGYSLVSVGILDSTIAHSREVFRGAIIASAASIILAHNHPAGDPAPSESDIKVTRDMIRAGQLLKIELVDHLIIGKPIDGSKGYCSLREAGYFST